MFFSLCIPTMDRYDTFLKNYLIHYIKNPLIDEILISDENGNDAEKIKRDFPNSKIKININSHKLGPFLNKMNVCKMAKNEWIVLIDSDNFADELYFNLGKQFIESNTITKNSIISPCFAKPNFNFTNLSNCCINKSNIKKYNNISNKQFTPLSTVMNTGNYIINKYLIDTININNDIELIQNSDACDVILFNLLLLEQLDLQFYIVSNLFYTHVVHNGSVYLNNRARTTKYINIVHNRYYNFVNSL